MDSILVDGAWSPQGVRAGTRLRLGAGRIADVEPAPAPGRDLYALPGFVNAHVHLDLTGIPGSSLPRDSFASWVRALVECKRSLGPAALRPAIEAGIRELLRCGTVAVGDIDSSGASLDVLRDSPLAGVAFREVLGVPPESLWSELDAREVSPDTRVELGISPHAPYSTPEVTFRRSFAWARGHAAAAAMHLGETREEIEFLQDGTGPLAELFASWRVVPPEWSDPGKGCVARVLELLQRPSRLLAVHCNHLSLAEEELLRRAGAVVVYCPRSHAYFGHPTPPSAPRLLSRGILVAVGTDSTASNHDLDFWKELACWRAADASVADDTILTSATRSGARALGLAAAELRRDDPATFQVVRSRAGRLRSVRHLTSACARGEMETVALCIRGRWVLGREAL